MLEEKLEVLREREFHAVCMPDFFLDHFVPLPAFPEATSAMQRIHDRSGGNLPTAKQQLVAGGNAANTAQALAYLGIRAHLIARTSPLGLAFLKDTLGRSGVDLSNVRADGDLAITTALEYGKDPRNVMLSFAGSVAQVTAEDLDDNARTLIEAADAVLVANWAQMRDHGTDFAAAVFRHARRGRALTYFDSADPSGRPPADLAALFDRVIGSSDLDVFAMNENELRYFGGPGDLLEEGARLAKRLTATLDVHTASAAATWAKGRHAVVPTFKVTPLRATGAGDVWNAANLAGYLADLEPAERLRLANGAAGFYIANPEHKPPTFNQIHELLARFAPERR
jgi:ribokinase